MVSRFAGTTLAPYHGFRPTTFWADDYPNGTYTGDIQGCNWTCEGCWSSYGWKGAPAKLELTGEQAAEKLVKGMARNAQPMSRISGGEVSMYWDHMVELVTSLLERTEGSRMRIPGITGRAGVPMGIILETNGSMLSKERLLGLEELWGAEAGRVTFEIGVKATSSKGLAELTGQTPKTAERNFRSSIGAVKLLSTECKYLGLSCSFLDRFSDPEAIAQITRYIERNRMGYGRWVTVNKFRRYQNKPLYVPKRLRAQFPERIPADDAETLLMDVLDPSGELPREGEVTDEGRPYTAVTEPEDEPTEEDEDPELADAIRATAEGIEAQAEPGTLRAR
jgi:uncharacterized Fe-S cluster-containing radical SAM superfamily protein